MITRFDDAFSRAVKGTTIPLAYLQALALHESAMKPDAVGPGGERGLLQIHPVTLKEYNRVNAKQITPDQSAEPAQNAAIAAWLIQRILDSYRRNHPKSLAEDWGSERFVGLVTQGYNSGEGEAKGVGAIVSRMVVEGIEPERITPATVAATNAVAQINPWLSEPGRLAYVARVVKTYFGNRERGKG